MNQELFSKQYLPSEESMALFQNPKGIRSDSPIRAHRRLHTAAHRCRLWKHHWTHQDIVRIACTANGVNGRIFFYSGPHSGYQPLIYQVMQHWGWSRHHTGFMLPPKPKMTTYEMLKNKRWTLINEQGPRDLKRGHGNYKRTK